MGRRASADRDHAGHAGWRERTAAMAGAVAALEALALLASWVGGLLGPDPADPDGLADAAALAGLGLFGLGCWLVPAATRWAGRLAAADQARPELLDVLVLLTLACVLGTAALALVLALADRG